MNPEQTPYVQQWIVQAGADVSPLRVMYSATKPADGEAEMPPYLRLYARRAGIRGKLTPRPVLRPLPGGAGGKLTVSNALKLKLPAGVHVKTKQVSENAYRWYRLSRAAGSLLSAFCVTVGALLVALGAVGSTNRGLLIAGVVVTLVGGLGSLVSSWRAPVE